jgi:lysophospholipase L1-like esterase
MSKEGISIDDLFALVADHPDYYRVDGVHSNEEGEKAEANRVTVAIASLLP